MSSSRKRNVLGAFLGTIVEYYDYSLYGFSAKILAEKFFPNLDILESLMYVFGIYAVSYLSKPLGSVIFSFVGDRYGRLKTLQITIIGIAAPTFAIGILPAYDQIGEFSAYILILCRFTQGFFVGGEYDGAAIYVIEHLGKKYHFTASAITRTTGVVGLLLGIAVTNFFNSSLFPEWGWRIPFMLSMPLAIVTIYSRSFLVETPDFISAVNSHDQFLGLNKFIKKNFIALLMVVLFAGGFGVTYQISTIFMKQYLPLVVPETASVISSFSVMTVLIFGIFMPISGLCADKFGKIIVVRISLICTMVACLMLGLSIHFKIVNLVLISSVLLAAAVAPFNALAHGVMIKAFSVKERYRGVGLGHTFGSMLMSGTANYMSLYFINKYQLTLFPVFYTGFFAIISYLIIAYFSRSTSSA